MKKITYLILIALSCNGCSRMFFGPDPTGSHTESFDYLCKTIDERYSLFDIKELDWEATQTKYKAMVKDTMSKEAFFDVCWEFMDNLQDGHSNIYTNWNYTRTWDWFLKYDRDFNYEIIEKNYLKKKYWQTGAFRHTIIDSIGYVLYPSFGVPLSSRDLNVVFDRMKNCKGIVLDIRNNGGGKLNNVKKLAARFADTTRVIQHFYFKTGPGHDDFTEKFETTVKPVKNAFTKPVVILMNRKSYSAATFFPAAMQVYPHVTLMGTHSGGGGGIPYHFELPNGWEFRISTTRTIDMKGQNIEPGIDPDVEVHLAKADVENGVDTMIEAAFELIRQK